MHLNLDVVIQEKNKTKIMAFKMKAGKEGPMMKNFPAAFKDNEDRKAVKNYNPNANREAIKEKLKKMAQDQEDKYGDPGKDEFGLKYVTAKDAVNDGRGGYIYKNFVYATKEDFHNALRKDNPNSKQLPENRGKRKIKQK